MGENTEEYHKRLKLRQDVEDMILFARPFLKQFPRVDRNFATRIENDMYDLLELCVAAENGFKFKTTMQEVDNKQKTIRRFILMAKNQNILPMRHYKSWSEKMVDIGKMVGGLLAAVNPPAQHRGKAIAASTAAAIGTTPPTA